MMKTMPNVKPTGYRTESWKKPDYNCARKLYRFNVIAHGSLNFTPSSWNYGKLFKFAMSTVPNITRIERSDDIPLLIAQMEKMEVAALLDKHFPTHGNWQSCRLGDIFSLPNIQRSKSECREISSVPFVRSNEKMSGTKNVPDLRDCPYYLAWMLSKHLVYDASLIHPTR